MRDQYAYYPSYKEVVLHAQAIAYGLIVKLQDHLSKQNSLSWQS